MEKKWEINPSNKQLQKQLSSALNISLLTAQLLINRGIKNPPEADFFLNGDLNQLPNPYLMKGLPQAVKRIKKALQKKENIMIYGDYDVDGLCSVAILVLVLKKLGGDPTYYIPQRLEEGYGLNKKAIKQAQEKGVSLIITVDCGITSSEEVKYAQKLNLDIIITDHHELKIAYPLARQGESTRPPAISRAGAGYSLFPIYELPEAVAILDPKQPDCPYPEKNLAGVGVAFKLAQALLPDSIEHLDLVALGTVADSVPLIGENRIIVKEGLKKLTHSNKPGVKALIKITGIEGRELTPEDIGFKLAPRINALGRLGDAKKALKLLLTTSLEEGQDLASTLNIKNKERQGIESRILKEAREKIKKEINLDDTYVIVLAAHNWHLGVVGIVASRIVREYFHPAILVVLDKGVGKGSARSIEGFHILKAFKRCENLLIKYGGHSQAAGLHIQEETIHKFKEEINRIAQEELVNENLMPKLKIDGEIILKEITLNLIKEIDCLSPYGKGNRRPLFVSRDLKIKGYPITVGNNHLKLYLENNNTIKEAIGYRMGDFMGKEINHTRLPVGQGQDSLDVAFHLDINEWEGEISPQLVLKDIVKK